MDLSYPPFETIDENGKPAGISVRISQALADYLGRPLRIENMPFVGLIPSLQNGRIDCIISSMTDTPERRQVDRLFGSLPFDWPGAAGGRQDGHRRLQRTWIARSGHWS